MALFRERRPGPVTQDYEEFHESMTASRPIRTYRPAEDEMVAEELSDRDRSLYGFEQLVRFLGGMLSAFLVIRIALQLLAANTGNGFAQFIYTLTYPLVAPFNSLFSYDLQYGVMRFDLPAVVAILVISLIAWGITRLLRIGRV